MAAANSLRNVAFSSRVVSPGVSSGTSNHPLRFLSPGRHDGGHSLTTRRLRFLAATGIMESRPRIFPCNTTALHLGEMHTDSNWRPSRVFPRPGGPIIV